MKGIILAGGNGTRLYPSTYCVSKSLLPIYDKPMFYYPLSTLMLTGIRDILIITNSEDKDRFSKILGNGLQLGLNISYTTQIRPNGIAEALILGENFIADDNVCLILGDNIFFGNNLINILRDAKQSIEEEKGAVIFGYYVKDPQRYGVVEFDKDKRVISIEEKPKEPKSNYAITGLYFYDNNCIEIAKSLKPSDRGELEITDVNQKYLKWNKLKVEILGRGFSWLDTGTHESILEASEYISIIEKRQGFKISCIEEIAFRMGYISKGQLKSLAEPLSNNQYGLYLQKILNESIGE